MTPVRYTPDVETVDPEEPRIQAQLVEAFREISETTHRDTGHGHRAVHAKSHALLKATFRVADGLPPAFAQGLFAQAGEHEALVRISTNAGDLLPDTISLQRGFAIKVFDVEGERLPGSGEARTQDFLLANGVAFASAGPAPFLQTLRLLAKTTDKIEGLKKFISLLFRNIEKGVEALGGESGLLVALGGHPNTNPLGERYYSQVPIRYGDYIAKLGLFPVSPNFTALEHQEIAVDGRDNALREEIGKVLAHEGGRWELRAQLCRDLAVNPIEDASVAWPEADNPYVAIAEIEVEPQVAWTSERALIVDDTIAFSPWHGIVDHRPLGAIMRARKLAYEASAGLRGQFNGCPMHEPARVDLPG